MKKKLTASDLMAKLNADPSFVARREAQEAERASRVAALRGDLSSLLKELQASGLPVLSASDLTRDPYPSAAPHPGALPVVLNHVQRSYSPEARELLARVLAVPEVKFAWNELNALYRSELNLAVKDGFAAAIAAAADDEVIGDLIALARDTRHGSSRLLLLSALERSADPRALSALTDLAADPDLTKEIQVILRRLKRAKR